MKSHAGNLKKKNEEQRERSSMPHALCSMLLVLCLLGCYGTEFVNIRVKVDSKVDMSKYRVIAVMDFIDSNGKSGADHGKILSRMIRKQLRNSKEFQVLDERDTVMDNEIDKNEIEDPNALVSISSQLGVDALIVGEFDFYQVYRPVPYIVERYSTKTGGYNPEGRTYIQKVYRLVVHAKLVDGITGQTVFDYSPPYEEKPEYRGSWGFPFSNGASDPSNLRAIAVKPIKNFVLSLMPHYENERRILVR